MLPDDALPLSGGIVRRATLLADGRELFYYDDPGTTPGSERAIASRALGEFHSSREAML